jgi:hypothetical protein
MEKQIQQILHKLIKDFNTKFTSFDELDAGITKSSEEICNLFRQVDVIGTLPLYKVDGLIKALNDIKDWDDDLEDEWEDQGYRAKAALKEWAS